MRETVDRRRAPEDSGSGRKDWGRRVVWAILALYALALLYGIASHLDRFQWDFRTYYYAGRAFSLGLDPYDMGALTQVAGVEIGFPYAYSPLVLPLFAAMAAIELAAASAVFLGLKVAALIALLALWRRWFVVGRPDPFFYLFLLFGFSGALYADFASGNISVFEQLGFWLGFVALRRGRLWAFGLLVIAISLFKLTPVLLLLLLPLLYGLRRPAGPLAGGLLIFAAALGLSYALWPDLFRSFLQGGWSFDERGGINPSSLALLRDGYDYLLERGLLPDWGWLPWAAYALWVMTVALLTWRAARRLPSGDRTASIYLGCLAFALIAPRFKNYSYALLLVPAYQLLRTRIAVRPERALLLLLMFSGSPPVPFGFSTAAGEIITGYYSLLGSLLVWGLAVRGGRMAEAAESLGLLGPADPAPVSRVARVDDD